MQYLIYVTPALIRKIHDFPPSPHNYYYVVILTMKLFLPMETQDYKAGTYNEGAVCSLCVMNWTVKIVGLTHVSKSVSWLRSLVADL